MASGPGDLLGLLRGRHLSVLSLEVISNTETTSLWDESEVAIAPGTPYEAPSFAAKLSRALPVDSDVTSRPEFRGALIFGLRFLW